jgi:sulfate transport system ATP-binding protein
MSVEVKNVTKNFGGFTALDNVSLTVESGELVALLGPSGSGKTTLLRTIAGLEFPDFTGDAQVLFYGEDVTHIPASQRKAGFAFQHYALFRHMSVYENIAFGLRVRPKETRPPEKEIRARVEKLLKLIQLEPLGKRFPSQLSGGQRQRVALARALAVEPKVLLLDEPFGALDAKVRKELRRWLRQLHEEIHITTLFVTHDQEEALEVADRVAILHNGKIEQIGTPEEIYDHPASPFVLDFLGRVNLFSGRVKDGAVVIGGAEAAGETDTDAIAFVRPHDIHITREPGGQISFPARVVDCNAAGPVVDVELHHVHGGGHFTAQLNHEEFQRLHLKAGDQVFVELKNVRESSPDKHHYDI